MSWLTKFLRKQKIEIPKLDAVFDLVVAKIMESGPIKGSYHGKKVWLIVTDKEPE